MDKTSDTLVYTFLLLMYFLRSSLQIAVHLNGKNIMRKGSILPLNCSTDTVPIDQGTDIQINEASHNYIRLRDGMCLSTVSRGTCLLDLCQCSTQGLWFSYNYHIGQPEGIINVTCAMVFGSRGLFSDTIQVQIIDFKGPNLTTNATFPMVANSVVVFSCKIEQASRTIKVRWECLDNDTGTDRMSTKYMYMYASVIKRTAYLRYDNQTCDCIVDIDGYIAVASVQIQISKRPIILTDESVSCTRDLSVTLSCIISNPFPDFGFGSWIHGYDGIFIRNVTGQNQGNRSTLTIDSCSQEDTGNYTCFAWNEYSGRKIYSNKTASLTMNDTDLQSSFEIQSVIFGIVAIGIFILTGTGTVMLSTRRKCKNIILIVGPHDLHVSPSIPIYHSAPGSENVPQIYDTANSGYLEVVHDGLQQATSFESDEDIKIENENLNVINVYEEID